MKIVEEKSCSEDDLNIKILMLSLLCSKSLKANILDKCNKKMKLCMLKKCVEYEWNNHAIGQKKINKKGCKEIGLSLVFCCYMTKQAPMVWDIISSLV